MAEPVKGALDGLRVLNTRPCGQASALSQSIRDAGGISLELPALAIEPTPDSWIRDLPEAMATCSGIFVSGNAVTYAFRAFRQHGLVAAPSCIAIGAGTRLALHQEGIDAVIMPAYPDSEHLLALDSLKAPATRPVLLFRGEGGRPLLSSTLRERGIPLLEYCVYRRTPPAGNPALIEKIWRERAVDIILCTSMEALHNLFMLFGASGRPWLLETPWITAGSRVATGARLQGIRHIHVARPDDLLQSLADYQQGLAHADAKRSRGYPEQPD